jgi:oligogalacturonide lyase
MPHSQIVLIASDTGAVDVVFEENYWIGHVNASPAQPHILTFCHEGPWDKVDQRIWGLDTRDGRVWKIRPTCTGERVGHEYWFVDGEHIGYHGRNAEGQGFYGSIRYDNTGQVEALIQSNSMHFHSEVIQGFERENSAS